MLAGREPDLVSRVVARDREVDLDAADRVGQRPEAVPVHEGQMVDVQRGELLHCLDQQGGPPSANAAFSSAYP
jgi:hypothetical protein